MKTSQADTSQRPEVAALPDAQGGPSPSSSAAAGAPNSASTAEADVKAAGAAPLAAAAAAAAGSQMAAPPAAEQGFTPGSSSTAPAAGSHAQARRRPRRGNIAELPWENAQAFGLLTPEEVERLEQEEPVFPDFHGGPRQTMNSVRPVAMRVADSPTVYPAVKKVYTFYISQWPQSYSAAAAAAAGGCGRAHLAHHGARGGAGGGDPGEAG